MAQGNGSAAARVALVHDFLVDVRGAERVFIALCDMFPDADLFTAVYDERGTEGRFRPPPRPHEIPAGAAAQLAHVSDAAAVVPIGNGVPGPARL
jgi:hypothetical protein